MTFVWTTIRSASRLQLLFVALSALLAVAAVRAIAADEAQFDTALVVSVDVSNSVDDERYKLQIEGIAKALEDPGVIDAITGGPNGGILFQMVTWADRPSVILRSTPIRNKQDALAVAQRVRKLPQQGGEFTCMTRMLRQANDKIVPQISGKATRVVIDVSGDGPENCNPDEPIETVRDELVASGVTINGLPIVDPAAEAEAKVKGTEGLEAWYTAHVKGGNGSFVLPAQGYDDFGRAIRQKFVIEISGPFGAKNFAQR